MSTPDDPSVAAETGADDRERAAAALARIRAAVRQRQAEVATGVAATERVRMRLLELKAQELVGTPPCFSPRPVIGPLLVFARKAFFKLFLKWYLHPVQQQQNRFNQVAARLLEELADEQAALSRRVARLEAAVAAEAEMAGPDPLGPDGPR